jgi:hypothetical protein
MLRAEESKMATHVTAFLAFLAISAMQWVKDLVASPQSYYRSHEEWLLKGSLTRDFRSQFFFMNQCQ